MLRAPEHNFPPIGYRLLTASDVGKTFGVDLETLIYFNTSVPAWMNLYLVEPFVTFGETSKEIYRQEGGPPGSGTYVITFTPNIFNNSYTDIYECSDSNFEWYYSNITIFDNTPISFVNSAFATNNNWFYVKDKTPTPTTIDVVETLTNCSTDSSNPLEVTPSSTGNIFFYHAQPQYAFGTPSVSGGTITDSSITANANGTTELMLEISVNADATSLGINVGASLIPTTYSLTNCTSDSNNPTSVSHQATGFLFTFHTTSDYAFTSYNVQNADITQHDITTYQDGSSDLTLVVSVNGLATSVNFTIVATPYVNVTLNVIGGGITASPNNPTRVLANSTNNVFGFTLGYGRNLLDYGVVNGSGVWVIDNNAISLTLTSTSVNNITINITTSVKMAVVDANRTQCTSTTTFPTSIDILSTHRFSFTPTQGYTLTTLEVTTQNVVWQRIGNDIIINTFNESVTAITISAIATISNATIHLYKNSAENIRVDKTAYLEPIGVIYGTFRETTGIIAPSILIQYSGLINFNYVYIADFNRYYYVSAVKSVNTNLWELELMVDVLYTYKDKILNLKAFVDRNENAYDPYITDEKLVVKEGVNISEVTLDNDFMGEDLTLNGNYILSGVQIISGGNS